MGTKLSRLTALAACLLLIAFAGCERSDHRRAAILAVSTPTPTPPVVRPLPADAAPQLKQFLESAVAQSEITTGYDPSYVKIDYPNGDVSSDTGVCSDVVVRAFRNVGVDLQRKFTKTCSARGPSIRAGGERAEPTPTLITAAS